MVFDPAPLLNVREGIVKDLRVFPCIWSFLLPGCAPLADTSASSGRRANRKQESADVSFCDPVQIMGFPKAKANNNLTKKKCWYIENFILLGRSPSYKIKNIRSGRRLDHLLNFLTV
jgi:hypothetical protein